VNHKKDICTTLHTIYRGKHHARYIRDEEITRQLKMAFNNIMPNEEQYKQAMESLKNANKDKVDYKTKHLANLQSELTRTSSRMNKLLDSYLDGYIDKDTYIKRSNGYKIDNKVRLIL
jgi:uncharacterized protein YpmS